MQMQDARDAGGGATKIGERVNCNSAIGPAKGENRRFHTRAGIIIRGQSMDDGSQYWKNDQPTQPPRKAMVRSWW